MVIGERIHCISPAIRQAFADRNPEPILLRAKEQLDAGADYLDLNIGPAEKGGEELMQWGVKILQENFDNVNVFSFGNALKNLCAELLNMTYGELNEIKNI